MSPPYEVVDIEPGWYHLVVDTHLQMEEIAPDYELSGVKQKFGELRYAARHENRQIQDQLWQVSKVARTASSCLCEWCGSAVGPSSPLIGPGWQMRLCPACADLRGRWHVAWSEILASASS